MADYEFLTTWILDAPLEPVWELIAHPEGWPEWWPGVRRVVEIDHGDGDGLGSVYDHSWRSVMPYTVRFRTTTTRIEKPHVIEARAEGELAGTGRFRFFTGAATVVTYEWSVRTTRLWMNSLAPIARPVFAWNHHVLMRRGGEGLAERLGAKLVARS